MYVWCNAKYMQDTLLSTHPCTVPELPSPRVSRVNLKLFTRRSFCSCFVARPIRSSTCDRAHHCSISQ
jgi:hypothetical protein